MVDGMVRQIVTHNWDELIVIWVVERLNEDGYLHFHWIPLSGESSLGLLES